MRDLTSNNFGIAISYLIPGLIMLWGASSISPSLASVHAISSQKLPSIGGFIYLASVR